MDDFFKGKVALITGAGSGIGRAVALAFARAGASVCVSDVDATLGEETTQTVRSLGSQALFVQTDVSKTAEVKVLVEKTVKHFKRLDFAFNNAGLEGKMANLVETSEENWNKVLSVNLKGVWLSMKYEIPEILKAGKGAIVNNASIAGLVGFRALSAYVASKHAIVGLTKTAAGEYAKYGLRINAICPGIIDTPMLQRQTGGSQEITSKIAAQIPMARLGTAEEIAEAVLWLCSDGASFVTGHALAADGGWVAQ